MRKRANRLEREFSQEETTAAFAPLQELLRAGNGKVLGANDRLIFGQIAYEIDTAAVVSMLYAPDSLEDSLAIRGVQYTIVGASNLGSMTTVFNLNFGDNNVGRGLHFKSNEGGYKYFVWLFPPEQK